MEAAFFDLDKTVIAKSSVLAFGRPFYREGLVSKRTVMKALYGQLVFMLLGADDDKMERMREAMLSLTRGWEQSRISEIVEDTFDEVVEPIIYAEALELIDLHRFHGRRVVIISSSPMEIVEPLARFLGVDEAIATRAEIDDAGRYTGELAFYAYGGAKAEAVRELAEREGIDLAASYAYSDSITDVPMLELVGNPTAVNPDRELARYAKSNGWDIREFRHPVRLRDRVPVPPRGPTIAVGSLVAAGGVALLLWWWLRGRDRERAHRPPSLPEGAGDLARLRVVSVNVGDAIRHGTAAVGDVRRAAAALARR